MLKQALESHNAKYISTGEPTYWPIDNRKIPDLLDFFITKGTASYYSEINSSFDLFLDHSCTILTFEEKYICITTKQIGNHLENT